MKFLKTFGLGIIYAILFPFFVVVLALYGVYGIANFFVQLVMMIVNFFRGKKLFAPYPEDEKAYQILLKIHENEMNPAPAPTPTTNVYVQQNYYTPNGQQVPPQASPAPQGLAQPNNPYQPLGAQAPQPGALPPNYQGIPAQNPTQNPQIAPQAAPAPATPVIDVSSLNSEPDPSPEVTTVDKDGDDQ